MSEFYEKKGIKKEFSIARTPQQNGVAERRNRTLIEAARTMLADSKLPTTFWAEAVNTACYVQNRVLVVKPHNKTPYELFRGRTPALSFMRPFGCHVTILNTLDYLGKFDGKSDEGFFVGYSMNSKDFRVYNIRTRKVEENLHIRFLEDKPIIAGDGPKWLFDIDVLTKSMNYVPIIVGTNSNDFVDGSLFDSSSKNASNDKPQSSSNAGKKDEQGVCKESRNDNQERPKNITKDVNNAGPSINTEPYMFSLGDNATLEATHADFFGDEIEVDMSNITTTYPIPSTLNTRIHKDHSLDHVIGDVQSGVQTRRMTKTTNEQGFISAVYEGKTHEDLHTCLFACFLSQEEPKRIGKALSDSAWGHTQEEGIDYDEVFAPVARIEAIRPFLAYASFMGFMVYQMDAKSAFLYGMARLKRKFMSVNLQGLNRGQRLYKEEKALYGLHKLPKACDILLVQIYVDDIIFGSTKKELRTEFEKLMHKKFHMSSMGTSLDLLLLLWKARIPFEDVFNDEYVAPSHTKKVFANMIKEGKGLSGTITPLFPSMLITQAVEGKGSGQPSEPQHTPTTASPSNVQPIPNVPSSSQPQKTHKHRKTKSPTEISKSSGPTTLVADETVHEERGESVERAATIAASLDATQDNGSGPKRQDTILGDRPAQTRVLDLEKIKDAQALDIQKLKTRVKKLEKKKKSRTTQLKRRLFKVRIESSVDKSLGDQEDASKQGRNEIDIDEGTSYVQEDAETHGRCGHDIDVTTASAPITTPGVYMKSKKSKEKVKERGSKEKSSESASRPTRGVTMQEPSVTTSRSIVPPQQQLDPKDKGKAKMIEPEKPLKKKDQIAFDEEIARRLEAEMQAELEKEERFA
ncbi:putative ribonuclease H-like domain-containing protein [Tanacetum coccineum]